MANEDRGYRNLKGKILVTRRQMRSWSPPTPGPCGGIELRTLPHHVRLMDLVFQDASRFDIIHFHCDYLHFPLLRRNPCPSVTTLHGRLHVPDLQPLFAEFAEVLA